MLAESVYVCGAERLGSIIFKHFLGGHVWALHFRLDYPFQKFSGEQKSKFFDNSYCRLF